MAGKGQRTMKYGSCKQLIKVENKYVVEWFFLSIKNNINVLDDFIFITTLEYENKFDFSNTIKTILIKYDIHNNVRFIFSDDTPEGPASSVYLAKEYVLSDDPCIVANSDQFIYFELPSFDLKNSIYLPLNLDFNQSKSYVGIKKDKVTEIVEKENISNIASSGIYLFSSGKDMILALEEQFLSKKTVNNEYYIAPAINSLIKKGYDVYPIPVIVKFDLGTVIGIDLFNHFLVDIFKKGL